MPLPPERQPGVRGLAIIGLVCTIPLMLFSGFVALVLPFIGKVDMGGTVCLGSFLALMTAMAVNFGALLRYHRLSVLGWIVISALTFGLCLLVQPLSRQFRPPPIQPEAQAKQTWSELIRLTRSQRRRGAFLRSPVAVG